MSDARYSAKTKKGYGLFLVVSAIQKAIRRGEEDVAMYFAIEMYESGYDEYLWKRLRIISSEDIGLGNPNISANIMALYAMYAEMKKKKDDKHQPQRLFLTHAILLLCRSKKSRMVDWTLIYHWESHASRAMDLPDYAYDKHNLEGRRMKRGIDHFYTEGTILNPAFPVTGEEEMRAKAYEVQKNPQPGAGVYEQPDIFEQ